MENEETNEIDMIEVLKRLLSRKKIIFVVTGISLLIGLLSAFTAVKVYTARCVFVPQFSSKSTASRELSSLASMAGIQIGDIGEDLTISPRVYPFILKNTDFQKDLMYKKLDLQGYNSAVSFFDYYTKPEYHRHGFAWNIRKYSIGLPGTVLSGFAKLFPKKEAVPYKGLLIDTLYSNSPISSLNKEEEICSKALMSRIDMTLSPKDGYITLEASMPDPVSAAQLGTYAFHLLQEYITKFKVEKTQSDLSFIKERYVEAKADYEKKQREYAAFQDANRSLSSAMASTKLEQLRAEYDLSRSMYAELSKNLLSANIKVKEDTPVLTAIEPISVPFTYSSPKRVEIILLWIFAGLLVSCGYILAMDYLKRRGVGWKCVREWKTENLQ